MKKAILLIVAISLSACQTNDNGKSYADKVVRTTFGEIKPIRVDPNCPWCLVNRHCKVPSCPNAKNN